MEGEKRPFIYKQNPVSLTPSWEGQKLTKEDNLNLKVYTMNKMDSTLNQPIDKYRIVFFIFILHGIGTLMPWNMFITAKSYFVDFKLPSNTTSSTTNYSTNFMLYLGFAAQIPNLLFNWLNIFFNMGGDLTKRIVYSILIEIVLFIITVILAMLDSSNWPGLFFWFTMISVVILNIANGIYQNTIYGIVATLPIKYTGAVVLGSNISGLFASIISICSSYVFSSKRTSAIYYFITAMLILLVCFDTYFALPLNNFFRYHETLRKKNDNKQQITSSSKTPYWNVFKEASTQMFNIFFTFFVTLAVFPAVYSDIKRVNNNFIISDAYFTPVTCFLTFNLFAMLGSLFTSWIQWPAPKYLIIPVLARAVFLPLFLVCNYLPKDVIRTMPVVITNDYVYWIIGIFMSFSSGYLSSLGMMYAPQTVQSRYQVTAGMFAAAILISGIFSGIMFAFIFPIIVSM